MERELRRLFESELEPGVHKNTRGRPVKNVKRDWKILCVIFVVIRVLVSVLISVARRRLVETENPSVCVCATVNWKVCKSALPLYGMY
jgi:hypothetical protein